MSLHKSVIMETLKILSSAQYNNISFNCLNRFMKGLFVVKAPKPRYVFTWNVKDVLDLIAKWMPLDTLSLKLLTYKLVSLIALCTAARAQTLKALDVSKLCFKDNTVIFNCGDGLKNCKPGQNFVVELDLFERSSLCPVRTLKQYLRVTKSLRKDSQLFVSYVTYKGVTTSTLARWLKNVLSMAGINIGQFKAHSFRGAASSAAASKGCKIVDILKTANWKSVKNFRKFYLRSVEGSSTNRYPTFQNCVLRQ
jgi:integrase